MKITGRTDQDVFDKVIAFAESAGLNAQQLQQLKEIREKGRVRRPQADTSVFADLFSDPSRVCELYHVLQPTKTDITDKDITIVDTPQISIPDVSEVLCFFADGQLQFLFEALAPLSQDMIVDMLSYLVRIWGTIADTNISSTQMYAIFPTADARNGYQVFGDSHSAVECRILCFHDAGPDNILGQYMRYAGLYWDELQRTSSMQEARTKAQKRCREFGLLTKYLPL